MARKLKTFTTSIGFFDLAVAAPSMKAALEAWDAGSHLFQHGFARQTDEPSIVAATMARPGVVLRRPVGTNAPFTEHADARFPVHGKKAAAPKEGTRAATPAKALRQHDGREAQRAFEKEQSRRERLAQKEKVALQKAGESRDRAIAAAEAALIEAELAHQRKVNEIEKAKEALNRKGAAEEARWEKESGKLKDALLRARKPRHLKLV